MRGSESNDFQIQRATFIWLILASVIGALLYISYYFTKKGKTKKPAHATSNNVPENVNRPVAGARRARRMRIQRDEDSDNDRFDDFDEDPSEWGDDKPSGKIGAKKMKKLQEKAEKRAERQVEIEEREDRKKRDALLAAERKKDEAQRQKEIEEKAEIERRRKEEQGKREHEEYLILKEAFTVEESGEVGILSEEESQSLLQGFIDYVKASKVLLLEDLAAHFNLKTQEAIERLENLQEMGRLTGVMDDRGKFIYISEEELQKVAKFIKQRGRVSITELADSSSTLINLKEETEATKMVNIEA